MSRPVPLWKLPPAERRAAKEARRAEKATTTTSQDNSPMNQVAPNPRQQLARPGEQAKPPKPIDLIRKNLDQMDGEFRMVLPQHIPVDRFKRIVLTAINGDEKLLTSDRKSLFGACMKAAQDGLLPDKREGALVIFNTKVKTDQGDKWMSLVQWMPMVYGIIKKMRNSGELASIVSHEVYEKDAF